MRPRLVAGWLVAAAAMAMAAGGCVEDAGFVCSGDGSCLAGRVCVDGACAEPDAQCDSKYRWDTSAGGRATRCAVFPDLSVSDNDMADPSCGNGVLDPGETCDPGPSSPVPCPTLAECDDRQSCTNDVLVGPACKVLCVHDYNGHDDDTPCVVPPADGGVSDGGGAGDGGVGGRCFGHVCCTGCWNGSFCQPGRSTGVCGVAGARCSDCAQADGGAECQAPTCSGGNCAHKPIADGTTCPKLGGVCHGGGCCTGCFDTVGDGGTCEPGTANGACGAKGNECASCMAACAQVDGGFACQGCVGNCGTRQCGDDGCGNPCPGLCPPNQVCDSQGQCVCVGMLEDSDDLCGDGVDNNCNGTFDCGDKGCDLRRCDVGSFCSGDKCQPGCRISGVFYPPGTVHPSSTCLVCDPQLDDAGWSNAAGGTSCNSGGLSGKCRGPGVCCTGCWTGTACIAVTGQNAAVCGKGGQQCASCDDGNFCSKDQCNQGTCGHANLPDGTLCRGVSCSTLCTSSVSCLTGTCVIGFGCKGGVCSTVADSGVQCCQNTTPHCCAAAQFPTCCP